MPITQYTFKNAYGDVTGPRLYDRREAERLAEFEGLLCIETNIITRESSIVCDFRPAQSVY